MKTTLTASAAGLTALAVALGTAAGSSGAGSATAGLAFVKSNSHGTTTWVAAADGSNPRQLGGGAAPLLSPNGALVAATTSKALAIYKVAGGQLTVPKGLGGLGATATAWSPDSRYLAVTVFDPSTNAAGKSALDVIDTTTGKITVHVSGLVSGASFEPGTSDTVAYALGRSELLTAKTDLYSVPADGSGSPTQLTHTGRALNPVWGARGILFDAVTPRKNGPAYQLAVLFSNGAVKQLTHRAVPELDQGLVPLALSADATKLVVEDEGEDHSQGYTLDMNTGKLTELTVPKQENSAFGISQDGTRVLVSYGGFEAPSTHAVIATMPFAGGTPKVLLKGFDDPSWNQ